MDFTDARRYGAGACRCLCGQAVRCDDERRHEQKAGNHTGAHEGAGVGQFGGLGKLLMKARISRSTSPSFDRNR